MERNAGAVCTGILAVTASLPIHCTQRLLSKVHSCGHFIDDKTEVQKGGAKSSRSFSCCINFLGIQQRSSAKLVASYNM